MGSPSRVYRLISAVLLHGCVGELPLGEADAGIELDATRPDVLTLDAAPPDAHGDEPDASSITSVCYPGEDTDFSACLTLVIAEDIDDSSGDYAYGDPEASPDPSFYQVPVRFVDLLAWPDSLAVAPHFVLGEFMQSSKGRYGLMVPEVVMNMETIRNARGEPLFVTSAFRSPAYNDGIDGAATWSRHMYGDAVDFYMASTSIEELEDDCLALGADYTALYDDGHIHCDWRYLPPEPAFFEATSERVIEPWPTSATLVRLTALRANQQVEYEIEPMGFDEGMPLISWEVVFPTGERIEGRGAKVTFVPPRRGTYRVDAQVGGRAAHVSTELEIAPQRRRETASGS